MQFDVEKRNVVIDMLQYLQEAAHFVDPEMMGY